MKTEMLPKSSILRLAIWRATLMSMLFNPAYSSSEQDVAARDCFLVGLGECAGFMSSSGKIVTSPRFEYIGVRNKGMLWCREIHGDPMSGYFVDRTGTVVNRTPVGDLWTYDFCMPDPEFTSFNGFTVVRTDSDTFAYMGSNGQIGSVANPRKYSRGVRYGIIGDKVRLESPTGHPLAKVLFDDALGAPRGGCIPVRIGDKWGLVDEKGRTVWPPQFDGIAYNWDGLFWIIRQGDLHGAMNESGHMLAPVRFDCLGAYAHGMLAVKQNGKWGVIDKDGGSVIAAAYDGVIIASADSVWVKDSGKWGFVGVSGKELCAPVYSSVRALDGYKSESLWAVSRDGGLGLVNLDGEEVLAPDQENAEFCLLTDDLVSVRGPQGWGIYSIFHKRYTVPRRFKQILKVFVRRNIVGVSYKQEWNLMNAETGAFLHRELDGMFSWHGAVVIQRDSLMALLYAAGNFSIPWSAKLTELPPSYLPLLNGVGKIVCSGKAGLIREDGHIALACRYEDVGNLSEGLVAAKHDGRWGYVNLDGKWILSPRYEQAEAFLGGYAAVRQNGKVGLIDRRGRVKVPFQYADAGYVLNGRFPAAREQDGKLLWGVADLKGQVILPLDYDCVEWIDLAPDTTRYHGMPNWFEY